MSILVQAGLIDKYGPRLTIDELADVLKCHPGTIRNKLSAGTFEIPTYLDGGRYADVADVAAYLDGKRKEAA